MEVNVAPALSINTEVEVLAVEFSPFEWSRALLAVVHPNAVCIYSVKFKEETDGGETEEFSEIYKWHVSSSPVSLAWSPASTLRAIPQCLQVAVASEDNSIAQLTSDTESSTVQTVLSHTDFVNSVTYNGDSGGLIASAGDDLTARIWDNSSQMEVAKFLLTSPGMVVQFHPEDLDLLMVAEKSGVLRTYSVSSMCSKISLRCPGPLLGADWSIPDPPTIVAAGAKGLTVWNIASLQPRRKVVEIGGVEKVLAVKVCRSTKGIVAMHTAPHTVRVTSLQSNKVPIAAHLKVLGGMSWHQYLPYLAVGSDRKVLLWKIDNI